MFCHVLKKCTCTSFREKGASTSVFKSTLTGGSLAMLSID